MMANHSDMSKVQALADLALQIEHKQGDHTTPFEGITLHIRTAPTEPLHCIYTLSLALILQGSKQISFENEILSCEQGQSMLTTFDLPLVSHVTSASRHKPFVGVLLKLDYNVIQQVCSELELVPSEDKRYSSLSIESLDSGICDAVMRLVLLKDEPELLPSISSLIEREIVIRLLNGPHGSHLIHLASSGSPSRQILSAVSWLKQHFSESVGMNELADRAHMSASNFRQRFKSLTGSSPLQYQKTLRLQEARDKMLLSGLDASQASSLVGYESPSQFSREYSRLFGLPPQKDIQRLRSS